MAAATKPLVLMDSADGDAAPQPVCITTPDGAVVKQAANVSTDGTVADVVGALIEAGLMAPASE